MKAETDLERDQRLAALRTHPLCGNAKLRKSVEQLRQGHRPHIGAKQYAKGLRQAYAAGRLEVIDITAPDWLAQSSRRPSAEGSTPSGSANFQAGPTGASPDEASVSSSSGGFPGEAATPSEPAISSEITV